MGDDRGALARAVAAAVGAVPGISRLVSGPGVPVATQYPGGQVVGVGLRPTAVSVHVAVDQLPMEPVITQVVDVVSAVLSEAGDRRRVEVVVEDVEDDAFTGFTGGTDSAGRLGPGEAR